MKKVALIAQKGGVGKTTIAVNLAVAAGLKTALFDLDQQESAVIWADRRKSEAPHVEFLTERRLPEAGTTNYKRKYEPNFPTVRISAAAPGLIVTKEQLEAMGLVAAPEPEITAPAFTARTPQSRTGQPPAMRAKVWPDYARSLAGAPPRRDGSGPDHSMADFSWCMTAIDWGWSIEDTAKKLPEVSEKARERVRRKDEGYPLITAQHAAAAVERNALKRGRG